MLFTFFRLFLEEESMTIEIGVVQVGGGSTERNLRGVAAPMEGCHAHILCVNMIDRQRQTLVHFFLRIFLFILLSFSFKSCFVSLFLSFSFFLITYCNKIHALLHLRGVANITGGSHAPIRVVFFLLRNIMQ